MKYPDYRRKALELQNLSVQINLAAFAFGLPGVEDRKNYLKALHGEMEALADYVDSYRVDAIRFTGPHTMQYNGSGIRELLGTLQGILRFDPKAEISVDATPGSVVYFDMLEMMKQGVKRISFDMGSFVQAELDTLGRTYSTSSMEVFMRLVQRKLTFFSYDISLFYGLPGQTAESLVTSIEEAQRNMAMHITLLPYPGADWHLLADLYSEALRTLSESSFEQYTPHHFARPDFACRWNKLRYSPQARIGLGIGAQSIMEGSLCLNTPDLAAYLASNGEPEKTIAMVREITKEDTEANQVRDALFNLNSCNLNGLNQALSERIQELLEYGLLQRDDSQVTLSQAGRSNWPIVDMTLG
jgi:oxygen-independent coproporphyrinogen-3 oxidase